MPSNLVKLTPEEHYVAHQLLVKIYPDTPGLVKAAQMMVPGRPSNKLYGWLRRRFAQAQSVGQTGEKNSQYGTTWINNEVEERKIPKSAQVPEGWSPGRKSRKKQERIYRREAKKAIDTAEYREYYKLYKEVGWEKFIIATHYEHSKQNFVMRCSRLLPEFVAQNGKKRGI